MAATKKASKKPAAKGAAKKPSPTAVGPKTSALDVKALQSVLSEINKGSEAALFKTGVEELLSDVKFWFPTGCPVLDIACGGGFPAGRITEVFGKRSSGKSTIVQHALAECQKVGGIAIYVDTEKGAHRQRFRQFGIDEKTLVHLEPEFLEDAFDRLFRLVKMIREKEELATKPILIVWDTIVFTPSRLEIAEKGDKSHDEGEVKTEQMVKTRRAGRIRAYMSHLLDLVARQNVAFVFVNHITDRIGAMYPGLYDKPGGTATEFAASLQVLVKADNGLKIEENGVQVGCGVKFKIEKTRLSVPKREVSARLNWFKGIDVPMTVLDHLKEAGLARREGAKYLIPSPDGDLSITTGASGEKTFLDAWNASPELQSFLVELIRTDYESVIPWKQPEPEPVPVEEGDAEDPDEPGDATFSIFG